MIKSTIGYDTGVSFVQDYKDAWPNDNPFTTSSTNAPITVETEKVTKAQTAMLEVFQWLYTSTMKPIISTVSTLVTSPPSGSLTSNKDDWGNSIETYRVDEPPHFPGLSMERRLQSSYLIHRHCTFYLHLIVVPAVCVFVGLSAQSLICI